MNLVLDWLSTKRHLESSFDDSVDSVKLVQACVYARKARESSFHHCGGPVKHVEACLSVGNIEESGFTTAEVL